MDALQQDTMQVLRHAERPVSAVEVASAIGVRLDNALDALGYLVRHGGARRHHCDDAVMRYSALASKRAARKPPKPIDPSRSPKAQAVLDAIDAGHVRARDVSAATGLTTTYTSVVLHRLEAQGLVRAKGHPSRAEWQRVRAGDNALPPNLARAVRNPLHDEDGELLPCVGERMRDTTHHIHRAAFEAQQEAADHEQN